MSKLLVLFSLKESSGYPAFLESRLTDLVDVTYLDEIDESERAQVLSEADYLLSFSPARELDDGEFDHLQENQILQMITAGVDYLPFNRLPERMSVLSNVGAYAEPMAEHVVAMYLALCKRLVMKDREMREGEFNQFDRIRSVRGSTCGIVGFGAVGSAAARLLRSLDVRIRAINRRGETRETIEFIGGPEKLREVMEPADGLVISAPLTPETEGLIDREKLEWMNDDAFVINVARGEIIEQEDLYEHLKAHPEFQAGIESWWVEPVRHGTFELDYPLLELPNVLACPHNSSMVPEVMELGLRSACENLAKVIEENELYNLVDHERGY